LLDSEIRAGRRVLFEGGQGTMLDVDFGSYPFVTSSSCVASSAAAGAGIAAKQIRATLGIAKAYTTRVGSGPFPTELDGETGDRLRQEGAEFGTTTGRPRRCGWFDSVVVRHSARLSALDALVITKLDVLGGFDPLRICVAYDVGGERVEYFPASTEKMASVKPIYEDLPGWSEDVSGVRRLVDLPRNARRYLDRIEELSDVPIRAVSVGASRDATIQLGDLF
jgi:adenylosuccinate synthase